MRLFYLSSKHRSSGTASDFTISLTHTLSVTEGARLRFDQLRLGVAFMLVNENNRNLFFLEGPHVRHAVLEIGNYSSESLAATLAFVMNAAAGMQGRVTCQYSTISGCTLLTYTAPASQPTWTFSLLTDGAIVTDWADRVSFPGVDLFNPKSFASVLGGYTVRQVANTTALIFRFISTQPYDVLFLCSRKLANASIQGPRGNCNTLMQITIDESFAGVQEASMPVNVWISSPGLCCLDLDFQVQDSAGNVVDMSLGGDVSFLLTIDDGND